MSATSFNQEIVSRPGWAARSWAWGRNLDREAALDSVRNVFAFVGVGAVLAYMGTMPPYLVPGAVLLVAGAWYLDYRRHF